MQKTYGTAPVRSRGLSPHNSLREPAIREGWPCYVSSHAAVRQAAEYSKPSVVLSDYPGYLVEESAEGRFHGSIGFRRSLCERIGGWPETLRADFDQQILARLREHAASLGDPCRLAPPQYVFRWHTGHWHG